MIALKAILERVRMVKKARIVFIVGALFFMGFSVTSAYFSDRETTPGVSISVASESKVDESPVVSQEPSVSPTPSESVNTSPTTTCQIGQGSVLINEVMANPSGDDDAVKPAGEWIELFNTTDCEIDLIGWQVQEFSGKKLPIISGNTNNGSTVIPSRGFMVVYRNGYSFVLNNDKDTVTLLDNSSSTIDSFNYNNTSEEKSFM